MTERDERTPDRVYILTERQFIESVLVGANSKRFLPPDLIGKVQRCAVERAENGGVVLRVWEGEGEREVIEPAELHRLLKGYAKELPGPVPTLAEVKAWTGEDQLAVSNWVSALHARAAPIRGMAQPDPGPQPEVLFEVQVRPAPAPAKKAAKKKKGSGKKSTRAGGYRQSEAILDNLKAASDGPADGG